MSRLVVHILKLTKGNQFSRISLPFSNRIVTMTMSQSQRFNSQSSTLTTTNVETPTEDPNTGLTPEEEGIYDLTEEQVQLTEEEILAKRDKSGLKIFDRLAINGEIPHPTPTLFIHKTVRYQQKIYAKFGEKSGLPPGIQWPDYEDVQLRLEFESVVQPFTFNEMVEKVKEKKRLEKEEYERRAAEVEAKMATVEKLKQEILDKITAKDKEAEIVLERREKLMEEVRRHFGYKVDPRDEKFQEMLEKKEKEQKKAMKESRKQDRESKMLALLLGKDKGKKSYGVKKPVPQPKNEEEGE